jgi:hypothetical protein
MSPEEQRGLLHKIVDALTAEQVHSTLALLTIACDSYQRQAEKREAMNED